MSRVLVVEPDPPLQAELLGAVRGAGYEGAAARDVDSALSALGEARFDAVVLDLPQESALPTVSRVLRAAEGGAVIAMAAAPSPELTIGVLRLGARALLRKPLALASLEATLGSATRGDVPVPPLLQTRNTVMRRVLEQAREAARTDSTLVLVGESGTGKDLLARYVHAHSPRRGCALAVVDCALSTEDGEDPLRELAPDAGPGGGLTGGTLLFHRVLEASPELQRAMVRLLHGRDLAGLPATATSGRAANGSAVPDLRLIVTSRCALDEPGAAAALRRDLRLRLDVLALRIPALRERPEDIPVLARELAARLSAASGAEPPVLTAATQERLAGHRFRGNVRELENLMRQAVLRFPGRPVDPDVLLAGSAPPAPPPSATAAEAAETFDLRELEKQAILRSLAAHGGNRSRASRSLGISTRTLRAKLRRYGLS